LSDKRYPPDMLKYFLYTIIAWGLLDPHTQGQGFSHSQGPVAYQQPTLAEKIAAHQHQWFTYNSQKETETQEKIDKLESVIESQVQAIQIKMGNEIQALRKLIEHTSEEET